MILKLSRVFEKYAISVNLTQEFYQMIGCVGWQGSPGRERTMEREEIAHQGLPEFIPFVLQTIVWWRIIRKRCTRSGTEEVVYAKQFLDSLCARNVRVFISLQDSL